MPNGEGFSGGSRGQRICLSLWPAQTQVRVCRSARCWSEGQGGGGGAWTVDEKGYGIEGARGKERKKGMMEKDGREDTEE